MIRKDFGVAAGERVARHMVAPPHREGGQAQFFKRRRRRLPAARSSRPARWAAERLDEPLDVAAMSSHAGVSPRTFARRFRAETGTTPLQWLLAHRVLEARRLLEESDLPVETVAWRGRLRHRRLAARPLPPRHGDDADRLSPLVQAGGGVALTVAFGL